jgi:TPR repeat protein
MSSKPVAMIVLLGLLVSASAAWADATSDYDQCTALPDQPAAVACIEKLAQAGNVRAELALGGFYAAGDGVAQNPQQAAAWYQKAAAQGNAVAMSRLGDAYAQGNGVTQDFGQAAAWYGRAASAGDPWSFAKLGSLYAAGQGVPQDDVTAYQWYDVAATRGDPQAAGQRDALAQKMTPAQVAEAQQRASQWLAGAAAQAAATQQAEQRAAMTKVVAECSAAVRAAQPAADFHATYNPAKDMIDYHGFGGEGPAMAQFNQCVTAKGYSVGAARIQ